MPSPLGAQIPCRDHTPQSPVLISCIRGDPSGASVSTQSSQKSREQVWDTRQCGLRGWREWGHRKGERPCPVSRPCAGGGSSLLSPCLLSTERCSLCCFFPLLSELTTSLGSVTAPPPIPAPTSTHQVGNSQKATRPGTSKPQEQPSSGRRVRT